MRSEILKLIHEAEYCIVSGKLDYINSAWKSVAVIAKSMSELVSLADKELSPEQGSCFIKELVSIIPLIMESQKQRDLLMASDVLESSLLPWLSSKASEFSSGDIDSDFDYFKSNLEALKDTHNTKLYEHLVSIEREKLTERIKCSYASSGDISFSFENGSEVYLTGANYPFSDALYYVYENRNDYNISYGLGGGCMIYELLALMRVNISTGAILFEKDKELLLKIFKYVDLADAIRSERVTFVCEQIPEKMQPFISGICLWTKTSTVKFEKDPLLLHAYEKYRRILLSSKEENYLLYFNYHENMKNAGHYVTEISDRVKGKTVYFIAGGPSLSKCYDLLRNREKDSVVLTVGTSAGKLLKEGIDPDFVIISDPLPAMKKQLAQPFDLDKTELLFLCTTYNYAVDSFGGKKYIVYQNHFEKAQQKAERENLPLFNTGGSVSTLAIDILLQLKAAKIICLGLDLAYTYNQMHASGLDKINDAPKDVEGCTVRAVGGGMVTSPSNLNSYREWLVQRLVEYDGDSKLINVSDGAFIDGMKNYTCKEFLEQKNL